MFDHSLLICLIKLVRIPKNFTTSFFIFSTSVVCYGVLLLDKALLADCSRFSTVLRAWACLSIAFPLPYDFPLILSLFFYASFLHPFPPTFHSHLHDIFDTSLLRLKQEVLAFFPQCLAVMWLDSSAGVNQNDCKWKEKWYWGCGSIGLLGMWKHTGNYFFL